LRIRAVRKEKVLVRLRRFDKSETQEVGDEEESKIEAGKVDPESDPSRGRSLCLFGSGTKASVPEI